MQPTKNRLVIIGSSGHAKVVANIAMKLGYTDIGFIDDFTTGQSMDIPIIGKSSDLNTLNDGKTDFVIAIGDNAARKKFATTYHLNYVTLIHPSAQIATHVEIGEGSVINANAVINPCAAIGKHCIINTGAIVEHNDTLEDFVHLSPNVALGGTVFVGSETHIGIGACVRNWAKITSNCVIGAGACVVKDITTSGTYVGIPATLLKKIT